LQSNSNIKSKRRCWKKTTTFNLGVALAREGKKVLLLDADPQGDLTTHMGFYNADDLPVTLYTMLYIQCSSSIEILVDKPIKKEYNTCDY
jgi:cellulose biosynthesis protein BcsQ